MKILVVDDEKDVEMLFRQKFRREINNGLELVFAFSGQEALEILEKTTPPNVMYIFSDINMPGMTGLELLKAIKKDFPTLKVMMVTAYGDDNNYKNAMDFGADDFVTKPVDFNILKEKILTLAVK